MTSDFVKYIETLDSLLEKKYYSIISVDENLTRKLVSFQANKSRPYYRWYKYKEAFSADLMEYLFQKYHLPDGKILDPFAGMGTSLFSAAASGYKADGIELLPLGHEIIEANIVARKSNKSKLITELNHWLQRKPWKQQGEIAKFNVLRITDGAYPSETHKEIGRYLHELKNADAEPRKLLQLVLLCVLEEISYTRKDGQCLRWDQRSSRSKGKNTFSKGKISSFDEAISNKLAEIIGDLEQDIEIKEVQLFKGSCLDIMPTLENDSYSAIITSPPYCNRYDYTRTYALEHAILGVDEERLAELRQAMLSCTVENKTKDLVRVENDILLLQNILSYLNYKKEKKELNNNGIFRMVEGYFHEMNHIIQECYRVLKKDGVMFMVNDNVKYAGVAISVDLILAEMAKSIGFQVKNILVLPQGKGNSSQQMGKHGRTALRKCIYVWIKK